MTSPQRCALPLELNRSPTTSWASDFRGLSLYRFEGQHRLNVRTAPGWGQLLRNAPRSSCARKSSRSGGLGSRLLNALPLGVRHRGCPCSDSIDPQEQLPAPGSHLRVCSSHRPCGK